MHISGFLITASLNNCDSSFIKTLSISSFSINTEITLWLSSHLQRIDYLETPGNATTTCNTLSSIDYQDDKGYAKKIGTPTKIINFSTFVFLAASMLSFGYKFTGIYV